MANQSNGDTSVTLPAEVADRLLDLLSSDDDFRNLFSSDPARALVKAGFDQGKLAELEALKVCLKVSSLAPKEVLRSSRDRIRGTLTSGINMQPIILDAGTTGGR